MWVIFADTPLILITSYRMNLCKLKEDLTYVEEPVEIIDRMDRALRTRTIPYVKVLWKHHGSTDATWELEHVMQQKYPELFSGMWNFEDEIS